MAKKSPKLDPTPEPQLEELEELRTQIEAITEALQRERADALNTRRRADEERAKMGSYYKAQVLKALMPALDNLERALKHIPSDLTDHDYVKGVQGVAKQFQAAFDSLGVERIATVGEVFNPQLHDAVSMEEGEGEVEKVIEELQPGFRIGDEVIRHAMVRVRMEPNN